MIIILIVVLYAKRVVKNVDVSVTVDRSIYIRYSEKSTKETTMNETNEVADTNTDHESIKLQLGRNLFSGAVAFGASKLADRVYDGAIRAYRARKS
jgi:hypothetical protein